MKGNAERHFHLADCCCKGCINLLNMACLRTYSYDFGMDQAVKALVQAGALKADSRTAEPSIRVEDSCACQSGFSSQVPYCMAVLLQ